MVLPLERERESYTGFSLKPGLSKETSEYIAALYVQSFSNGILSLAATLLSALPFLQDNTKNLHVATLKCLRETQKVTLYVLPPKNGKRK